MNKKNNNQFSDPGPPSFFEEADAFLEAGLSTIVSRENRVEDKHQRNFQQKDNLVLNKIHHSSNPLHSPLSSGNSSGGKCDGIIRYLSSGLIKGVGPSTAQKIVEVFGELTMDIIENQPDKLSKVSGIGAAKIQTIHESWKKNKGVHSIVVFLQEFDIGISYAIKIWQRYGKESLEIIKQNPYVLFNDIKGIGFLSADKIAMRIGIDPNSNLRAAAAIEYVLQCAMTDGSCCEPALRLIRRCSAELGITLGLLADTLIDCLKKEHLIAVDQSTSRRLHPAEVSVIVQEHISVAKSEEIGDDGTLDPLIFTTPYYYIERGIARKLVDIKRTPSQIIGKIDPREAIIWLYQKHGIRLAKKQQDGIADILNNKCCVITGGPGTGKTTMLHSILLILKEKYPYLKVKLVAPTGRAAKRLSESTEMPAYTIHRLLEFDPIQNAFRYNETNRLNCDLLVLDESSMIDAKIMYSLLKALPLSVHLIIVGDVDQLPSVGPGDILLDIIKSRVFPITQLDQIFRQAAESDIVCHAHAINNGEVPKIFSPGARSESGRMHDCVFFDVRADDDLIAKTINFIQKDLPPLIKELFISEKDEKSSFDLLRDLQVLSPMQKGPAGVRSLNTVLQRVFNRSMLNQQYVERFGSRYYVGDKIMQTENNYNKNVFNGDIGFIRNIDYSRQEVTANFDGHQVIYRLSELEQIVHAYAVTIHKSQGSEYPIVLIPVVTQHFVMLKRRLFYTALTRARRFAIFLGQRRAMAIAVQNKNEQQRNTILGNLLQVMEKDSSGQ